MPPRNEDERKLFYRLAAQEIARQRSSPNSEERKQGSQTHGYPEYRRVDPRVKSNIDSTYNFAVKPFTGGPQKVLENFGRATVNTASDPGIRDRLSNSLKEGRYLDAAGNTIHSSLDSAAEMALLAMPFLKLGGKGLKVAESIWKDNLEEQAFKNIPEAAREASHLAKKYAPATAAGTVTATAGSDEAEAEFKKLKFLFELSRGASGAIKNTSRRVSIDPNIEWGGYGPGQPFNKRDHAQLVGNEDSIEFIGLNEWAARQPVKNGFWDDNYRDHPNYTLHSHPNDTTFSDPDLDVWDDFSKIYPSMKNHDSIVMNKNEYPGLPEQEAITLDMLSSPKIDRKDLTWMLKFLEVNGQNFLKDTAKGMSPGAYGPPYSPSPTELYNIPRRSALKRMAEKDYFDYSTYNTDSVHPRFNEVTPELDDYLKQILPNEY
ncbi:MAG TPA: hypothetical protein VMW90_07045 [Acidobacteriota bacterium]|nr:hypothetical protein [Acidobacteriota bacterium]